MAVEQSDVVAAPEGRSSWRGWLVAAVLLLSTVGVLYFAAPQLLCFGVGSGGSSHRSADIVWDIKLPSHVAAGEFKISIAATIDGEVPHQAALLAQLPVAVAEFPGVSGAPAGSPVSGKAQLRIFDFSRDESTLTPFRRAAWWTARVSFEFDGSCDGHPLRCRGEFEADALLQRTGLISGTKFEQQLAETLATSIVHEICLDVGRGR